MIKWSNSNIDSSEISCEISFLHLSEIKHQILSVSFDTYIVRDSKILIKIWTKISIWNLVRNYLLFNFLYEQWRCKLLTLGKAKNRVRKQNHNTYNQELSFFHISSQKIQRTFHNKARKAKHHLIDLMD